MARPTATSKPTREMRSNLIVHGQFGANGTTPPAQADHIADPAAQAAMTATLTGVDTGTDMTAAQAATLVADLAALDGAVDANNAAIDAILVVLENLGLTATS